MPPPVPGSVDVDDPAELAAGAEPSAVLAFEPPAALDAAAPPCEPLDDRRSTFAQPEPLNTIAGVDSSLRIVPSAPHSGQNRGPWSWMPWTTSVTRPQALQA